MNREEAIEVVRSNWPSSNYSMLIEALETLIPELAESEDEKNWKAVFYYIKDNALLAWLKKQKEQLKEGLGKYSEEGDLAYRLNWVMQDYIKAGGDEEEQERRLKCYKLFWDSVEDTNFFEQKEQKPVMIQWTGKNLKEVIDFTGKSPKFGEWFKSWGEFEEYVHSHNDILKLFCEDGSHYEVPVGAWIVKTPDGYNIPSRFRLIRRPAEWSEDTVDAMVKAYSDSLPMCGEFQSYHDALVHAYRQGTVTALKSLRPQPKQEWSEEDEGMINCIISTLCEESHGGRETNERMVSWLDKLRKSLRPQPHWKPSEEQMNELLNAVSRIATPNKVVLDELYRDLKKLM